jgi:uncharacterized damage-inducible protein DinB
MPDPLVETWQINARIDLFLLGALPADDLRHQGPTGGRSVGEVFAHIHNVRLMWIKAAQPSLPDGLEKVEKVQANDHSALAAALTASARAIATLVTTSLQAGGKVKGFKPHVHAFVGYLISHESHHRGQIMIALKHAGRAVEKGVAYGLWEWGSR